MTLLFRTLHAGFSCPLCKEVLTLPVTAPCAHNFCKSCLEGKFVGQAFVKERTCLGGRKLRSQKNVMKCPCCENDIADFLQNLQVIIPFYIICIPFYKVQIFLLLFLFLFFSFIITFLIHDLHLLLEEWILLHTRGFITLPPLFFYFFFLYIYMQPEQAQALQVIGISFCIFVGQHRIKQCYRET